MAPTAHALMHGGLHVCESACQCDLCIYFIKTVIMFASGQPMYLFSLNGYIHCTLNKGETCRTVSNFNAVMMAVDMIVQLFCFRKRER